MKMRGLATAIATVVVASLLLLASMRYHVLTSFQSLGLPTEAQADNSHVYVKSVPSSGDSPEHEWRHFAVTAPVSSIPLDLHIAFLVDGKGTDFIYEQSYPWPHPMPLKICLDDDDDQRIKVILKAQRLPVKEQFDTYHFAVDTPGGMTQMNQTLTFVHKAHDVGPREGLGDGEVAVGENIPLADQVIEDAGFHGDLQNWQKPGALARFPAGQVHRLTVYLMLKPHNGPAPHGVVFDSHAI